MTIQFYGADEDWLDISYLIKNVREELEENLKMPIELPKKVSYINQILQVYSSIENQISEEEIGKLFFNGIKLIGFEIKDLDKKDKDIFESTLVFLKKELRSEILFLNNLLTKINQQYAGEVKNKKITEHPENQLKLSTSKENRLTVKSFVWNNERSFKRDIILLFESLKSRRMIPRDSDFNDFTYAFSGTFFQKPLNIRWIVTGKNKQTSKSSLFHFISRLEDYRLIESKEWSEKNYMQLYHKIELIFTDKDGNPFSIEGLKSSRCQGISSDCAMQEEIDQIVKIVAIDNSAKTPE